MGIVLVVNGKQYVGHLLFIFIVGNVYSFLAFQKVQVFTLDHLVFLYLFSVFSCICC